ncbi:MarR family winged helix-turn-helix transcriptional regulator [Bacillus sp. FJAT-45066]|uniref:MarR family winged helix-turn-helix transcriptional regulator n=1 Tax=Bacillus sp. FJAT-45066 TaxID=2011010 RepID=UPI000BB68412|nr:MarR family winged helix-turn-helix transcriptional regulator [Bacillus sp. FJAT-45066]
MREYFQTITRRFGLLNKTCCTVDGIDVSVIQSHTLYEIEKNTNPSIQQVADLLGIDITTFSRQVQTLVKMKLIEKVSSPEDKRVTLLVLSELGKKVALVIDQQVNNDLKVIFSQLTPFEQETVERSIKLLAKAMIHTNLGECNDEKC